MLKLLPLLAATLFDPTAQEEPTEKIQPTNLTTSHLRDILLIVGAAAALALILFLWAYLTRKGRQREAANSRGARAISRPDRNSGERHGRKVKIRRRREHPDNLPRNPTLAEAGGLPPLRPEEPDPPPPQTESPQIS